MNVTGTHVGREQCPGTIRADFPYRGKHDLAAYGIERIWRLVHQAAGAEHPRLVGSDTVVPEGVVLPVCRPVFVAMQMMPVAGERDQVGHYRRLRSLIVAP